MTATATKLGPIGINQVNNVFYVGDEGGFTTIQAAVDYIHRYNGGVGEVIIVHGYSGSDDEIGTVINGSLNTYISDQRDTLIQNYAWTSALNRYTPAEFNQLSHANIGGQITSYGFLAPDFTSSNASMGTGGDIDAAPGWALINANAPSDQRLWAFFAIQDRLIFSSEKDSGIDNYWLQAFRAGEIVNKVVITPNTDVTGILTSQGSPVRTFANSPDGGGGGGGVNPGATGQLSFYEVDGPLVSPSLITTDAATGMTLTVPSMAKSSSLVSDARLTADRNPNDPPMQPIASTGQLGPGQYVQQQNISVTAGSGFNYGGPWSITQNAYDTMYSYMRGISQIRVGFIKRFAVGDTAAAYYYVRSDGGVAAGSDEGCTLYSGHVLENRGYFHASIATTTGYGDQAPVYASPSGQPDGSTTSDGAFMLNISKGQIAGWWGGDSSQLFLDTGGGATGTYLNQLPIDTGAGRLTITAPAWVTGTSYAAGNIVSVGGTNYVSLTHGNTTAPPSTKWVVLPPGRLPLSTAIGVAIPSYPNPPGPPILCPGSPNAANNPYPRTFTVNLVNIGGTFPRLSVNDVVWAAASYQPEQSRITAVVNPGDPGDPGLTTNQQQLTMALRNPHGDTIVFAGGIQGQYISMEANLRFSGMRSSYYALGSIDGTRLIYAVNTAGSVTGRILPFANVEAAKSSGPNSDFKLFPGAEVVCIPDPSNPIQCTLEQNGVRWEATDSVENPHYPCFGGSNMVMVREQISPTVGGFDSSGINLSMDGTGIAGGSVGIRITNGNPATNYYAANGPVAAPSGMIFGGFFNNTFLMGHAPQPGGYILFVGDTAVGTPVPPGTDPTAPVGIVSINYSGGGNMIYSPALSQWSVSGGFATHGIFSADADAFIGGSIYFLTNRVGGGVQFTGANDDTQLIFSTDGSSSNQKQQILAMRGGFPINTNIYYDTITTGPDPGGHVFRGCWYDSPPDIFATIERTGLQVTGTINATGGFGPIVAIAPADATANTNGVIDFGSNYGAPCLLVFDAGVGARIGMGLNPNELQLFINSTAHFSWNKGGDFEPSGTNEVMRLDAATGALSLPGAVNAGSFAVGGAPGVSGTITSASTVTVVNGLITAIV